MGKISEKKKLKREQLLMSAYSLFIKKGVLNTSISDIANGASMGKGTFYLYFKDKMDIRDKLIATKMNEIISEAIEHIDCLCIKVFEERIIYMFDYLIEKLARDLDLLRFISDNLSWNAFKKPVVCDEDNNLNLYDCYWKILKESGREFRKPRLMLFMIVELINSTRHGVLLEDSMVTLDELKSDLYPVIIDIMHRHEVKNEM